MTKYNQKKLESEVKETLKAKERYRWYKGISKLIKTGTSVVDACKQYHIGRSEYYYWHRKIKQILDCSKPGRTIRPKMFLALSRKPHYSPKQIPKEIENIILKYRDKTNQGAEYIRYYLITKYQTTLSETGIYKVLKREGRIKPRKYHQKKKKKYINRQYLPGEKIQVDTKYVKTAKGKTYYQYSAIDVATGIIYKQLFETIEPSSSVKFLLNIINYYPFKIKRVQTDNGLEYTWRLHPEIEKEHPFDTQCRLLEIQHVCIPPASPTFNSHVERTHRIDNEELWRKHKFNSFKSMKKYLKKYVRFYNLKRATPSKNWRSPVQFANDKFGLNITSLKYLVQNV